jgi:N-methylhydantoinase A
MLAVRLGVVGRTDKPPVEAPEGVGESGEPLVGERPVWSAEERRLLETPVYDGGSLAPGAALEGPAIVELASTTIVVPAGFALDVDAFGTFAVHAGERGAEFARRLRGVGTAGAAP